MTIDYVELGTIPGALIAGLLCNLLAIVFFFVWPKAKAAPYRKRISWPGFILHYFHPLAWELFGMAAFMQEKYPALAVILFILGGACLAAFVVMLRKA